jgi:hypothetical protein
VTPRLYRTRSMLTSTLTRTSDPPECGCCIRRLCKVSRILLLVALVLWRGSLVENIAMLQFLEEWMLTVSCMTHGWSMLHVVLNVFFLAQIRFLQNLQLRFTVFDLREQSWDRNMHFAGLYLLTVNNTPTSSLYSPMNIGRLYLRICIRFLQVVHMRVCYRCS